jgi:triacylglycerol esterase/lipase EstA (alpha/beta hydrolase family)
VQVYVQNTVYALHVPKQPPTFDIVFLHGLQWGATKSAWVDTWSCEVDSQRVCWPVHFLTSSAASHRFERLRILSVTYNADAIRGDQPIQTTGEILTNRSVSHTSAAGVGDRPVVFVGHSLGGLVMKQLISVVDEYSRSPDEEKKTAFTRFFSNMRAMVFYGTPHSGSPLADTILTSLGGAMLPVLEPFNAQTDSINHRFETLTRRNTTWQLRAFAESQKTRLSFGVSIQVAL